MKTYKQLSQQFGKHKETIRCDVIKLKITKHPGPGKRILVDAVGERILAEHYGPKKKRFPESVKITLRPEAY